ncbi:anthranilate phosphoribosyltransferase family protein [Gloeocapsa sp. PCC 73106]|uniref:anthranilate phosphoribosyltransferase family protein n=1 Tax=Gloeocapsa sp. PCC 73106 TaxID=102232 RepID=UPI0002AC95D1|nr:anthranilate phosphoribosyltransferase family protein [Gloeocapsa sp. PCC 73106]ELR98605.1 anthranilate phosphoribosyltransferase [Gloeocapsa sp. PCC 73106]
MSEEFRELLKKVGSGQHTKKDLSRTEAATAMKLMLEQKATPAQIGAFLIAHRIKRPTGAELAGMLDTYEELGPILTPLPDHFPPVAVFGIPYDGRSRTAPVTPITALILATAGIPTLMHGGDIMPTKYGIPLIDIWSGLGLDFTGLSLEQAQAMLINTGFTFIYTSKHFPQAQDLVPYRDQIGKRPPLATLELIWSPYRGKSLLIAGYVHPPTENTIKEAFNLRGQDHYLLVKGLEGSCDLRLSQTTIISASSPDLEKGFSYLKLSAREYNLGGHEILLESKEQLLSQTEAILQGKETELMSAAIWNGGFYLWRCGVCPDVATGINRGRDLLVSGQVAEKYEQIRDYLRSS